MNTVIADVADPVDESGAGFGLNEIVGHEDAHDGDEMLELSWTLPERPWLLSETVEVEEPPAVIVDGFGCEEEMLNSHGSVICMGIE